jgi:hypothetical protein
MPITISQNLTPIPDYTPRGATRSFTDINAQAQQTRGAEYKLQQEQQLEQEGRRLSDIVSQSRGQDGQVDPQALMARAAADPALRGGTKVSLLQSTEPLIKQRVRQAAFQQSMRPNGTWDARKFLKIYGPQDPEGATAVAKNMEAIATSGLTAKKAYLGEVAQRILTAKDDNDLPGIYTAGRGLGHDLTVEEVMPSSIDMDPVLIRKWATAFKPAPTKVAGVGAATAMRIAERDSINEMPESTPEEQAAKAAAWDNYMVGYGLSHSDLVIEQDIAKENALRIARARTAAARQDAVLATSTFTDTRKKMLTALNSGQGDVGIQNKKISMAIHAMQQVKSSYDPKTKTYKFNKAIGEELNTTLATLLSGSSTTSEGQRDALHMKSLQQDLREKIQYLTGNTEASMPQDFIVTLIHMIERQGEVSESLRDAALRNMAHSVRSTVRPEQYQQLLEIKGSSFKKFMETGRVEAEESVPDIGYDEFDFDDDGEEQP